MTTIAFRSGTVAADTQMTSADAGITLPGLKLFIAGRYVVGFAGDLRFAPLVERWFEAGCPIGDCEFSRLWENEWDILAMDEDGRSYICLVDTLYPLPTEFYAVGSGCHFAMGALHKGATARDAVLAAARFDIFTNAVVETLTVRELRKHLKNVA